MMINVTVGTVNNQNHCMVNSYTTLRQCLEDNSVNYTTGQITLNGNVVAPGQLDCTFAQMGAAPTSYLLVSMKTNNARA